VSTVQKRVSALIGLPRDRERERLPRPRGHRHNRRSRGLRARVLRAAGQSDPPLGRVLPQISLPALPSGPIDLRQRWDYGTSVILSSLPGVSRQFGGLQRHLAHLRSWQQREPEFSSLGYELAFVCAQALDEQRAWVAGEDIDLTLLSDVELTLAASLRLPTVASQDSGVVYDDVTLVIHGSEVGQVFYAAHEPQNDPETVLRFLREVHG
jgi:hypothetical protein